MAHDDFGHSHQNLLLVICHAAVVVSHYLYLLVTVHLAMSRQDKPGCDVDPRFAAQAEDPSPGLALV